MTYMRQFDYVDILVKRPVKIALQDSMKHGETYGQAILRLIDFFNSMKKETGASNSGLTHSTSHPNGVEHE